MRAGRGGDGAVSFRREAYVPRGGPDGGNGGAGGSVFLQADPQLHTLLDFHFRTLYEAERGRQGSSKRSTGRSGADLIVKVPLGTRVYELSSGNEPVLLDDLIMPGQMACVAQGGRGGLGNAVFKTSTNQAPRRATPGREGEERLLLLELKLMADVGLVGLPNAGKSTLLSVLTAARPKVAPYPFTTLHPNLGVVRMGEYDSFVLADLPGLIEGASEGKGLGHEFLRHVERTRVLVYLLDGTSDDPRRDLRVLKAELKQWNPDLLKRPSLTVMSKSDLPGARVPKGLAKLSISSATGANLDLLVKHIWSLLQNAPLPEVFRTPTAVVPRKSVAEDS